MYDEIRVSISEERCRAIGDTNTAHQNFRNQKYRHYEFRYQGWVIATNSPTKKSTEIIDYNDTSPSEIIKLTFTPDDGNNGQHEVTPRSKDVIDQTPPIAIGSSADPTNQSDVTDRRKKKTTKVLRPKPTTIIHSDNDSESLTYEDSSGKDDNDNADPSELKALIAKLRRENNHYKRRLAEVTQESETDITIPSKKKEKENRNLNKKVDEVLHGVSTLLAIVDNKGNIDGNINRDEIEATMNSEPDNDGKIIVNGRAVYANAAHKDFEATTMKKRCNKIIDALWTTEEQLKLALQANDHLLASGCRNLTFEEIDTVKNMCRWLQTMKILPTTGQFNIDKNHRKWISDHLKHNREMHAPQKREKYLTRKREECVARCNKKSTRCQNKKQRTTKKSSAMENDDAKAVYAKLKCLLSQMVYDEPNANEGMEENDKITLTDISREINLDEDIVKQVLTPDSCIIIEDIHYHPVDFNFEISQLYTILLHLKTLNEPGTNMKLFEIQKMLRESENYDEKIIKYLFEKYTTSNGEEQNEERDQLYRFDEGKIMDGLFAYVIMGFTNGGKIQRTYRNIISECKKLPYCNEKNELDWEMLIIKFCTYEKGDNGEIADDSLIGIDETKEWGWEAFMIIYQNCTKILPE